MAESPIIHLRRALRRRRYAMVSPAPQKRRRRDSVPGVVILAVLTACVVIAALELRLRPIVESTAAYRINHRVTEEINDYLQRMAADYEALVTFHRDADGAITALTADMAAANRIRADAARAVLSAVSGLNTYELGVPLGSLVDLDLLWGKGPVLRVRGLTAGTVDARLDSEFRAAGVNQTLHRILLNVTVPVGILLPGGCVQTRVDTSVCLAETLIVGKVPQAYFSFETKERGGEYGPSYPGDPTAAAGAGAGGI